MKPRGRGFARMLLCLLLLAAAHSAASAQNCRAQLLSDIAFGSYDPLQSGALDTTGMLRLKCSPATVNVAVRLGPGLGGGFQPRYMQSGSNLLAYNLFLDPTRTIVWGDGTSGTSFQFYPTLGHWVSLPVYARTPLGQSVAPGSYSDTVVVTIEW